MVEYGETGVAEEVAEVAEESEIGIEGPALLQHEGLAPRASPSYNLMRVLCLGYDMVEYGDTGVAEEVAEEVADVAEESEIGIEGPALLQNDEGLAPRV
eukprot:gene27477-4783_t